MRRTLFFLLSRSWRPHSERIQCWIASAANEPRQLQQARSYMYELKLEEALEDVDDAVELLYLMHRAAYPAGSHLETRVQEFLAECAGQVAPPHLIEFGRRLREQPTSAPLWSRVVLEQAWFAHRATALLEALTLQEHITFCAAVWRAVHDSSSSFSSSSSSSSVRRHVDRGAAVAVSQQLAVLTARRLKREGEEGEVVCLCASLGIPLQEETLATLRELLLTRTRDILTPAQVLEVGKALAAQRSNDVEWLNALQMALCRKEENNVGTVHAVGLLKVLAVIRLVSPDKKIETLLLHLLPTMSTEEILDCCESLAVFPNSAPNLQEKLRDFLNSSIKLSKFNLNNDTFWWQLRSLSLIASEEAKLLILDLGKCIENDKEKILSLTATQNLIRCMQQLQIFPPELVSCCKVSFLQNTVSSFTQEDGAYLLYAAANTGESANGTFFNEALNRFTSTRKFDRRKNSLNNSNNNNNLPIETLKMVLQALSIAKGGKLSKDSKVYTLLRDSIEQHKNQESLDIGNSINILKILVKLEADDATIKTSLLTGVSKSINTMTSSNIKELCEVLVALKSRDVLMFKALLTHLSKINPDKESITVAAMAAKRLKFVPYFQQSLLVERITSLEGWNVSEIVLVASACSEKQRKTFLSLSGAKILLEAKPEDLSTIDLFLLLSITKNSKTRISTISEVLKSRPPLVASDMEVEDAWRAFTNVINDKQALASVCRTAAATMQTVDENMLMRFLESATTAPDLPNVFFRVVGKAVLTLASSMTVDNALRWLNLYVKYQIRDDSVGKALLSKIRTRSSHFTGIVEKTIREAANMYGKSYSSNFKGKKQNEKVEWYTPKNV